MYKLKPVFEVLDVQSSCTMYKLKNLHEKPVEIYTDNSHENLIDGKQLSGQEIEALIKKQNEVLNTLEQLELRLSKLNIQLPNAKETVPIHLKESIPHNTVIKKCEEKSNSKLSCSIENLIKTDTVVFANPEDPPYSLLAIPFMWPVVSWDISYHVHSSIENNLKELETIKFFKNVSPNSSKETTVKIYVIWQNVKPSPKIIRSPTDVVYGEVALLLMLHSYLSPDKLVSVESCKLLELINDIAGSTDRTPELYSLINVSNTQLDLVNVILWSLLYQKKQIPPRIQKWLEPLTKMIISKTTCLLDKK